MIYLLYGEDTFKARDKAHEMIESLKRKKPDAGFFELNGESFSEANLEEYIGGQGLFSNKYIVFLDSLFEEKEVKEIISKKLKEIGGSENIFIVLEGPLDKATLTKFEKNAEKIQPFDLPASATKGDAKAREFNIFSMSDALGARDKKNLWVLYYKAKRAGLEDEQIHGTLFWAIKNMLLASGSASAKEAGLNPFVFGKAKGFASNFTHDELVSLSGNFISLYHDSRRGIHDLDIALEKCILSF